MNCLRPSVDSVAVVKVKRSSVRRVHVPYCEECLALREAKAPAQIQFERIGTALSFLLAWAAGVAVYMWSLSRIVADSDRRTAWALLLGALAVITVFGLLYLVVRPWSLRFRSLETKAVLASVTIRDFDWDTTVLDFASEDYAERFARVNQMEPAQRRTGDGSGT